MDSRPIGSDELVYIQTEKVNLTIKGPATHPRFQGAEYSENNSTFIVSCDEEFELSLKGGAVIGSSIAVGGSHSGT